jgi:hypothetical protein
MVLVSQAKPTKHKFFEASSKTGDSEHYFGKQGDLTSCENVNRIERSHKFRLMTIHELKTIEPFFRDIVIGHKTCVVSKLDRDFKVGDTLALKEYDPGDYYPFSGNEIEVKITHVLTHNQVEGVQPGWCVISFDVNSMKPNFILDKERWMTYP